MPQPRIWSQQTSMPRLNRQPHPLAEQIRTGDPPGGAKDPWARAGVARPQLDIEAQNSGLLKNSLADWPARDRADRLRPMPPAGHGPRKMTPALENFRVPRAQAAAHQPFPLAGARAPQAEARME